MSIRRTGFRPNLDSFEDRLVPTITNIPANAIAVAPDSDGIGMVRIVDPVTTLDVGDILAYETTFRGGVRTALGDVTGDGVRDLVIAPGVGGGPRVRIVDGANGATLADFFAYESTFTGGLYVAVGDVNNDGRGDVITGTGEGGGPRVRVLSGATLGQTVLRDFFAYEDSFRGGVLVAAGDADGDGDDDVITGTGVGGGPRVQAFTLAGATLRNFFAYEDSFRGGVLVAAGDVNGDHREDLITGTGPGGGPVVLTINGSSGATLSRFLAADTTFRGGVRVDSVDTDANGTDEVIATIRQGTALIVKVYNGATGSFVRQFTRTVDDLTTNSPTIALTGFSVAEGNSGTTTANFAVNLSAAATSTVTVAYTTSNGTATAGTDYVATSGTLTFTPGTRALNVPVTINGDTTVEGNETLTLTLSNPTNATLSIAAATGTIVDDDSTQSVTLTPALTQGPFFNEYSDATHNRSDVTTGTTRASVLNGTPLVLTLNVFRVSGSTITPVPNARVDIWEADAIGKYSDEASEGTTGETFLRGYQTTDANGSVTFRTIVPGWYSGRTPHTHFMVRDASTGTNLVTSQLFYDPTLINTIYANSPYNTRGTLDTTNATDGIFNTRTTSGAVAGSMTTLTLVPLASGGYSATYNIYVA